MDDFRTSGRVFEKWEGLEFKKIDLWHVGIFIFKTSFLQHLNSFLLFDSLNPFLISLNLPSIFKLFTWFQKPRLTLEVEVWTVLLHTLQTIFQPMPRENSKGKRLKRIEKLPIPSFDDEVYVLDNPFEKFSILFGKNVDFASFTFEVPSFHIEEVFIGMGWTSIATLEEHAYPNLIKS